MLFSSLRRPARAVAVLTLLVLIAAGWPRLAAAQETPAPKRALPDSLTVMTFNVLYATPDDATIRAIRAADADVVGLQEISEPRLRYIADALGFYYHHSGAHEANGSAHDTGLLSRYPISVPNRFGATIFLTVDDPVHLFNVHLSPYPYEPYQLRDGEVTPAQAEAQARATRGPEIAPVLEAMERALERGDPVFLTGDFNEPSHHDWTPAAAQAGVHQAPVAWPVSTMITDGGLTDAFRAVHPDEVARPAPTWTTLDNNPDEVHDRIDLIYFAGDGVRAVDAFTVGLRPDAEATDRAVEGYPSDHRAVVSVFALGSNAPPKE